MSNTISAPTHLTQNHELGDFDCGESSLNEWLKKRAFRNGQSGASRTYVITDKNAVIGYYCLSAGAISRHDAPKTLQRNMPDPLPVMIMGRLAIHKNYQNCGLGSALLREATLQALHASEEFGICALLVHALSESAKRFYLSHGFVESPIKPMTLCLILATIKTFLPAAKIKKRLRGKARSKLR